MGDGSKANRTGGQLESFIEDALVRRGYTKYQGDKKTLFGNRAKIGGKQYAIQVPVGKTIYQTSRKADVVVFNQELFPDGLIIECKWQQSKGSVDEKFPYLLFNILKTKVPTIVLLEGGGYKPAAADWLRSQANMEFNRAYFLGVYGMVEMQTKINNGLFG